jgi:hypothetical protein
MILSIKSLLAHPIAPSDQDKPNYLRGHFEGGCLNYWMKNVFILHGLLIAVSLYQQSNRAGLLVSFKKI